MARLGDVAPIKQGTVSANAGQVWLLNLDMVESESGNILEFQYVSSENVGTSTCQFDTRNVLYSKLRPYLNKVVLPDRDGFATSEMLPLRPDVSKVTREYLTYYLRSPAFVTYISEKVAGAKMPRARTEDLQNAEIPLPSISEQKVVTDTLDRVISLINVRKQQLAKLDELVKARFVEMFGDPAGNSKKIETIEMQKACYLKAGVTTMADEIHDYSEEYQIPCYGGNGIRGYVQKATQKGSYPIIGRQGALCGNVQLATGAFHATEHAVLVTPLCNQNVLWLFYMLKYMDLFRYHTGAAQPGLAVKTLNEVRVIAPSIIEQNSFANFVTQVDRLRLTIQQGLDKLELLKKAIMQQFFG